MRLAHAAPTDCARRLKRGEVKRFAINRQLLAYTIGCPRCGFAGPYLHDEVIFVEGPMVETRAIDRSGNEQVFDAPASLSTEKPAKCFGCGRVLRIVDNVFDEVS